MNRDEGAPGSTCGVCYDRSADFTELCLPRAPAARERRQHFVRDQMPLRGVPVEELIDDPVGRPRPEPYVTIGIRCRRLYPERKNSLGLDLSRRDVIDSLTRLIRAARLND